MNKRQSFLEGQFNTRTDNDEMVLTGYFIKYRERTKIFEGLFEEIDSDAVTESLKNNDIRALFNHDSSLVLGRTGNGTLTLESDDVGLKGTIIINPKDPQAVSAYAKIQRGDVTGCSFGFYPLEIDQVRLEDGSILEVVKELDLLEVSPCTFPAYPQTEIAARQEDVKVAKKRLVNLKKEKLKEKIKNDK